MSFSSYFSPTCETRELHSDPGLRTRYYRNNFKQCLEAFEKMASSGKFDVRNVNPEHGELYVISNGYDIIVTITQVTPIECGIDFKVNFFSFAGFGRPKKKVIEFYKDLDKLLKFKGTALHP